MTELTRADLWTLEDYAVRRPEFRRKVIVAKKLRQLALGDHLRLHFENALTIRYQIQEMLRIEKTFEPAAIEEELAAYNPLIPDGNNWKATLLIEYEDPGERNRRLRELVGVEHQVWLQIDDCPRVFAVADEDLDRSTAEKTAAVHFLRYDLTPPMIAAVKAGAKLVAGVDHRAYPLSGVVADDALRASLAEDLREPL